LHLLNRRKPPGASEWTPDSKRRVKNRKKRYKRAEAETCAGKLWQAKNAKVKVGGTKVPTPPLTAQLVTGCVIVRERGRKAQYLTSGKNSEKDPFFNQRRLHAREVRWVHRQKHSTLGKKKTPIPEPSVLAQKTKKTSISTRVQWRAQLTGEIQKAQNERVRWRSEGGEGGRAVSGTEARRQATGRKLLN